MKIRSRLITALAVFLLLLASTVGIAPVAQAATGNILPPFDIGQTWNICQGYNNPNVTHTGTSSYGLDLTGAACDNSAAGRNVRAPMAGTIAYYQATYGNLCVNTPSGSYTLTHINSGLTGGAVNAGQLVGTVAAAGQRGNNGVAHIHFQMWATANCYNSPGIPFDSAHGARICGAPDLTASGPNGGNGTWSNTSFTGASCESAPTVHPTLTFIKTAGTTGNVEIHWASEVHNFANWSGGTSTWFNVNNAASGTFTLHDMDGDARSDLVYIKTQGTSTGRVELHWVTAASNFSGIPISATTWFSTTDAANGVFMMGRLNSHPNLVFIKTANTGNTKVELHYASSTDNFASWAGGTSTWFSLADVNNGTFTLHDMDGMSGDDLVFIKTQNTGGKVELHWLNAATGFVLAPASYTTWFNAADVVNGSFTVNRLYGTNPGLVFIKKANTSGKIEIHFVSSANNYSSWANGGASWFSAADASNGLFTVGAS